MINKIFQIVAIIVLFISLTTFAAYAGHFDTDLQNLEEQLPGLATAYFKIFLREAWAQINISALNLTPVKIGILDTGVDAVHPEFEGVDFGNTPPGAKRDFGELGESHGTNVAGIIGANNISASASYIFPQMNGILSGVKNLNYTLESRTKSMVPVYTYIDARKEINNLVRVGTRIINISLTSFVCVTIFGTEICNPIVVGGDKLFANTFEHNPDTLFVVAAGNEDRNVNNFTPARLGGVLNNVISVGASDLFDSRLNTSNFGGTISISAPGEQVYTPTFFITPLDPTDYDPNFTDTSASAPMVTGVAGLIKAIKPELTPAQIKQILQESADAIFAPVGSDEAGKLLGSGCSATSIPAGQIQRGCRLNAFQAVLRVLLGTAHRDVTQTPSDTWTKETGIRISTGDSGNPDEIGAQTQEVVRFPVGSAILTGQGTTTADMDFLRMYYGGIMNKDGVFIHQILSAVSFDEGTTWLKESGIRLSVLTDEQVAYHPSLMLLAEGGFRMYFESIGTDGANVRSAVSPDGILWTREQGNRITNAIDPFVIDLSAGGLRIYFVRTESGFPAVFSAVSPDGTSWTEEVGIRLARGNPGSLDAAGVSHNAIIRLPDGRMRMYYTAGDGTTPTVHGNGLGRAILSAISNDGFTWTKEPGIRIDIGSGNDLDSIGVFQPSILELSNGSFRMFYQGSRSFAERFILSARADALTE